MQFARHRRILVAAVALIAACSESTAPLTRLPPGNWGGPDLTVVATASGASLSLRCESGVIAEPLTLDASGDFAWTGTAHPAGNIATAGEHPALYSGHASRTSMTITRTITDGSGYAPWTYSVTWGMTQQFIPCPAASVARP